MKRTTFLFTVLLIAVTAFASENEPPVTPRAPIPEDNSSVLTAKKILSWECFDPDFDALTYDVYFGTSAYPPLVKKDHETSSYSLGGLQKNETYYWRVVAKDTEGHSVSGPIWRFTTNTFELGISFGIGIPRGFPLPGVKIEIGDFSIGLGYMGDLFIPLEWRFIPFGRGKSGYFYVVPGFDIIIKWGGQFKRIFISWYAWLSLEHKRSSLH